MSISFRFDNLEYQRQAINSVISLLEGQSQDANKIPKNLPKKRQTNCKITISQFIPTLA